jgi:hypothetical protein
MCNRIMSISFITNLLPRLRTPDPLTPRGFIVDIFVREVIGCSMPHEILGSWEQAVTAAPSASVTKALAYGTSRNIQNE